MNTSSSRPTGVTLVAILYLALAIVTLVIAARYVLFPNGDQAMILLFTRLKLPVTLINLLAAPPLIVAGVATLLFRGLWQQRLWGWAATLFFSFLGMLASLAALAFFMAFDLNAPATLGAATGAFILFTLIFLYFLKTSPTIPSPRSASHAASQAGPGFVQAQAAAPQAAPPAPPVRSESFSPPEVRYETIHSAPTVALPEAAEAARPIALQPTFRLIAASGPDAGKQFDIYKEDILIGRHPTLADVHLSDPTVSARHARIRRQDGEFQLIDLASSNGSYINGERVEQGALRDQDVIRLGATTLIFSPHGSEAKTTDA